MHGHAVGPLRPPQLPAARLRRITDHQPNSSAPARKVRLDHAFGGYASKQRAGPEMIKESAATLIGAAPSMVDDVALATAAGRLVAGRHSDVDAGQWTTTDTRNRVAVELLDSRKDQGRTRREEPVVSCAKADVACPAGPDSPCWAKAEEEFWDCIIANRNDQRVLL